jgi:hypothetical protein
VGRSRRRPPLAGRGGGFGSVGEVIGPNDRGAADFHLSGQPVESFSCFPTAVDLCRDLLVLGHERLAGLTGWAAAAIDAARRPLPGAVEVESVANDLRPDAERARDQIDPRPSLGHLHDLRQHYLVFRRLSQRYNDLEPPKSSLARYCPTVTMQELPKADGWIISAGPDRQR